MSRVSTTTTTTTSDDDDAMTPPPPPTTTTTDHEPRFVLVESLDEMNASSARYSYTDARLYHYQP